MILRDSANNFSSFEFRSLSFLSDTVLIEIVLPELIICSNITYLVTVSMPSPDEASTSTPPPPTTFKSLGLIDPLLEAIEQLKYTTPTDIQVSAIPHALEGRDIIGVASTGSGKTAAFALPILQKLWEEPKGLFACVLAPTRELAFQISQQFESLGAAMGVRCATIIGGVDLVSQQVALAKRPHIVVATPGRLQEHLEKTKGFSLRTLKFLVCIGDPSDIMAVLMQFPGLR